MSKEIQCKCCKDYWWETNIHSKSGLCPNCYDYVSDLEAKLAEKDELLRQKIGKMKSTDFIRMCKECDFMVEAKENDNQTAIAELKKVKEYIVTDEKDMFGMPYLMKAEYILEFIDQQIKSLKGGN